MRVCVCVFAFVGLQTHTHTVSLTHTNTPPNTHTHTHTPRRRYSLETNPTHTHTHTHTPHVEEILSTPLLLPLPAATGSQHTLSQSRSGCREGDKKKGLERVGVEERCLKRKDASQRGESRERGREEGAGRAG